MILFLLFLGSLIFIMLYFYPYFDLVSMWIKKNGVYISISIFLGSIFLSWFKRKNYYNPDILKNTETVMNNINTETVMNNINTKTVMNNINTKTKNRRNVSNSMKKIVASLQKWKCGDCANLLDFTYEIDHKIPLFKGGLNSRDNLIALCRLCHGRKTILEINNK